MPEKGPKGPQELARRRHDMDRLGTPARDFLHTFDRRTEKVIGILSLPEQEIIDRGWTPLYAGDKDKPSTIGYIARIHTVGRSEQVSDEVPTDLVVLNSGRVYVTQPRVGLTTEYNSAVSRPTYIPLPVEPEGTLSEDATDEFTSLMVQHAKARFVLGNNVPEHTESIYLYMDETLGLGPRANGRRRHDPEMLVGDASTFRAIGNIDRESKQLMGIVTQIDHWDQNQVGRAIYMNHAGTKQQKRIGYILPPTEDREQLVVLNNGLVILGEPMPSADPEQKTNEFTPNPRPLVLTILNNELYTPDGYLETTTSITVAQILEQYGLIISAASIDPEDHPDLQEYVPRAVNNVERIISERESEVDLALDAVMGFVQQTLIEFGGS
jgi:hypothetical protein